ncbi:caspase activity and apoptosis inhibitor 1 isoform X2 [Rhinatrema bivittatum]|uniref:caspase activity and apoptosis inhibitor 1 isoform X2 n=1 Tax=Rhinatrema bivittatum TaxID=194408 RepID=UPI00112EDAB3|nr:caspase activity and apoptosis inhibitor 1 isoform X2 [Rhinatrema bivittatum]
MASNQRPSSSRPSTKGGVSLTGRPSSAARPPPTRVSAVTGEVKCPSVPLAEQEAEVDEPSDIEEGGLDLSVPLKPISFYIADKKEMLQQCFRVVGEKKLQKMLPDILKDCSLEEIKRLCLEQLELMSEKKLMKILEGENGIDSATDEEGDKGADISQQDNNVDSTSSLRESTETEGLELKQVKGEDSDALSINADAFDSDIEGIENEEGIQDVPETAIKSRGGQGDDLQMDIDKSVNEILGLAEPSPEEPKSTPAVSTPPPPEDVQPSAQQLELLELEMRARAIKALMKAGDGKKISA